MKHIIVHHGDSDGRAGAAIIVRSLGDTIPTLIEMDYKNEFPLDLIGEGDKVYIVDFSLKPEVMSQVLEKTLDVTWLDHHPTTVDYDYGRELPGVRKVGEAGCELAWKFFFPEEPMPLAIKLIGDFDCWRLELPDSIPFIEGLRLRDTSPKSLLWEKLLDPSQVSLLYKILKEGDICGEYRKVICEEYAKDYGWETEWEGHKAYACGVYKFGSFLFGEERMENYPLCISYEYLGDGTWQLGLYSETVDVGKLCKELGEKYGTNGGGHKGAGGVLIKGELPFRKLGGENSGKEEEKEEGYNIQEKETLRERLADLAHQQWGGWMEHLFSVSSKANGTVIIPKEKVKRWTRQMNTPYSELSEEEKELDRKEADRVLELLG